MRISARQATKTDLALLRVLKKASGHEFLRAIMVLGNSAVNLKPVPDPTSFSDRTAYRTALLENQRIQVSDEISDVKQELNDLSLQVKGGEISRAVIVEGTARDILSSLELPDVKHASLDQSLQVKLG